MQPELNFDAPLPLPDFDGKTYEPKLDHARLGAQLLAVKMLMADGAWRTAADLEAATGYNWASISARLRDLRKPKFGGHTVERRRVIGGLFEYRLLGGKP